MGSIVGVNVPLDYGESALVDLRFYFDLAQQNRLRRFPVSKSSDKGVMRPFRMPLGRSVPDAVHLSASRI